MLDIYRVETMHRQDGEKYITIAAEMNTINRITMTTGMKRISTMSTITAMMTMTTTITKTTRRIRTTQQVS